MNLRALETLPAFAGEAELGKALLGARRAGEWRALAPLLERRGLPKIDPLMGGRYVPAVKAFFDSDNGLAAGRPLQSDGVEDLGAWKNRLKRPA